MVKFDWVGVIVGRSGFFKNFRMGRKVIGGFNGWWSDGNCWCRCVYFIWYFWFFVGIDLRNCWGIGYYCGCRRVWKSYVGIIRMF